MNRSFRHFIFVFLSLSILLSCQFEEIQKNDLKGKTRIAIVNSDVWYLTSFINLIEKKIIDIPNLELKVIIYSKTNQDYKNLVDFLKKWNYQNISAQKIDGDLEQENLFKNNSCSESFYKIFKETDGILFLGGDDICKSERLLPSIGCFK
jgi:hypothetical protein